MSGDFVTRLDELGMRRAAREAFLRRMGVPAERFEGGKTVALESLGDLIKREDQREKDGFPKRIRYRRVLVGGGRVIVVPHVSEGKLYHGEFEPKRIVNFASALDGDADPDIDESVGRGEGDVGDIVGRMPLGGGGGDGEDDGSGDPGKDPGSDPAEHGFEEEVYETGKRLAENLSLPNIKDKLKKVPTDEYAYDLTDRHKRSGQVLDKKETLRRVVRTNLILGRIDAEDLDTTEMLVAPDDRVYRVLSRERVWKSQAVVFFMRDYSGSMFGEPTKSLVAQHLMIYAWLMVQYEKRVVPRFIVHDTQAREVTAQRYFGESSGGGTLIASGYKKINEIVEGEALDNQYSIYVFQGSDGDDGDDGKVALPEIQKILSYASRMGVTLFKHPYYMERGVKTVFEEYIERGGILARRDVFRMHTMSGYNVTEEMNIVALKALIAQD